MHAFSSSVSAVSVESEVKADTDGGDDEENESNSLQSQSMVMPAGVCLQLIVTLRDPQGKL